MTPSETIMKLKVHGMHTKREDFFFLSITTNYKLCCLLRTPPPRPTTSTTGQYTKSYADRREKALKPFKMTQKDSISYPLPLLLRLQPFQGRGRRSPPSALSSILTPPLQKRAWPSFATESCFPVRRSSSQPGER